MFLTSFYINQDTRPSFLILLSISFDFPHHPLFNITKPSHSQPAAMGSQPDYTHPPQQVSFAGFLFDMDGTIIDSTPAIVKHWHKYVPCTTHTSLFSLSIANNTAELATKLASLPKLSSRRLMAAEVSTSSRSLPPKRRTGSVRFPPLYTRPSRC